MKKFKSFVVFPSNLTGQECCITYAGHLGYHDYTGAFWGGVWFRGNGEVQTCCNPTELCVDQITLDEFFALTPEDVVIEPERFKSTFKWRDSSSNSRMSKVTQEQVCRILAIMGEES